MVAVAVLLVLLFAVLAVAAVASLVLLRRWDKRQQQFNAPPAPEPSAEEIKQFRQQQAAFEQMMNYNQDIAYGITRLEFEDGD